MPCFHPVQAWKPLPGSSRKKLFFRQAPGSGEAISVPCGQCIGCRMSKAQEWQTRLHHEAMQHETSSFLTLTYSDEYLPPGGTLCVRDLQLFMKRLRKAVAPHRLRFFACGEYGDRTFRPHYHVILFGYDFPDRLLMGKSPAGFPLFVSPLLSSAWSMGKADIGAFSRDSAGYVARYCLKKVNGERAEQHYRRVDPATGEVYQLRPEFITMSSRPGIGAEWFRQFACDAFPSDFVVIDGERRPVPRYYLRKVAEEEATQIKAKRVERAEKHADNNTPERLAVREEVLQRRVSETLQRRLDRDQ